MHAEGELDCGAEDKHLEARPGRSGEASHDHKLAAARVAQCAGNALSLKSRFWLARKDPALADKGETGWWTLHALREDG